MSDDKYIEDRTSEEDYYDGGLINAKNIIIGSAIAAGSILAYKSGALRPIIQEMMKTRAKRKPVISVASNDLRKWFASDGDDLVESSIFRLGVKDTIAKFAKFDKENAKEVIKHTKLDIQTYNKRLSQTLDDLMNNNKLTVNNTYHNTGLVKQITEADNAAGAYSHELADYKRSLKSKMYDTIIKDNIQTKKQATERLRKTGYRTAELNDVFNIAQEDGKIKLYEKTNFSFDGREKYNMKSAKEQIEGMLNSEAITESGIKISSNKKNLKIYELNDDFKHLQVDKSIHIDSNNNIIDLRNKRASTTEFVRNLATEWQIPVISINPLQMIGVDKIGRNKVKFATIKEDTLAPALTGKYGRSLDNTIMNVKNNSELLKGVKEGVTIINGDVFKINESGNGITKIGYNVKKNITAIPKEFDRGTGFLTRNENAQRKQFGLGKKEFEEFGATDFKGKVGKTRYFKKKVADTLDLGHQEVSHINEALDVGAVFEPDGFIQKIFNKIKPFAPKSETTIKTISGLSDFADKPKDNFFITNDRVKLKDTINNLNKDSVKRYAKQAIGLGNFSKDFESVTPGTLYPYFLTERLNGLMSSVGLGLSLKSTKSTGDTIKNIVLKRFLPVYGAYQALNFINMFGEGGDGDKPGNIDQHLKSAYVKADVGLHNLADKFGVSKMFKSIAQITPGSDMLGELPILNVLTPSQTGKERADYWNNGYDAVRKGRYWSLNSTPFIGGKIAYWKPNMYRRSLADAKYSNSLYGSRYEQYSNMLNPRHYDVKHYNTRPYLMTSPAFENVPIVGPVLSGTIGKIVAPQRRMHEEYWNNDNVKSLQQIEYEQTMHDREVQQSYAMSQEQIQYNSMRSVNASKQMEFNSQQDLGYIMNMKDITNKSRMSNEKSNAIDVATLNKVYGFNSNNTGLVNGINTQYSDNSFNSSLVAATRQSNGIKQMYMTSSGAVNTVQFNGEFGFADANKINKKGYTLGNIMNVDENATAISPQILSDKMITNAKMANPSNPNSIANSLKNQYKDFGDVAGMYGFVTTDFFTGTPGAGKAVIDTPGYSRSFNRTFWDQDLGGYGGDISEIFRRLVQKRRTDQNYYNPVKNRMPNWLPGDDGFIDFRTGDPYSKVSRGEERLPGEGYERLNHISMPNLLKMKVGSSTIGKTKEEIIKHFLHQDELTDPELMKKINAGTKLHEEIEAQLVNSGVAIDTEIEMKDNKNGIIGYYDARIHDSTSLTGEAIVDIKTVGADKLDKIRKDRKLVDYNQRQVNWYLHETNPLNKGYLYYVDREDPTNNYTVGFNYSHSMYKSTMNTLKQAREDISEMMHKGQLSRGDLYDPVDRLRILGDVAPYSDEFKMMNKQISGMTLDEKDSDEVKAIRDRVAEQRRQTRFYNYRFKNNKTVTENGIIDRQIDNEKFMIKGSDSPIKLAGINFIQTDNPKYDEGMKFLQKHMGEGHKVQILVSEDPTQRKNGDFLRTTKATVISDGININKQMIKRGYAQEDEKDFSAAGTMARFNGLQRNFGKAWEGIAHADTFVNTKLLQVRTAKEDYERNQVYDKDFKSWTNPIKDFLYPSIWTNTNRSTIYGVGMGAVAGYMFGRTGFGKLVGSVAGVGIVLGSKAYSKGYEAAHNERWIPKPKREQRDRDDYIDKLTFLKNRRLFEVYADKSKKENNFDVRDFLEKSKAQGNARKAQINRIKNVKRKYQKTGKMNVGDFEDAGVKFDWKDKLPSLLRGIIKNDSKQYQDTYDRILDFGVNEKKEAYINATRKRSKSAILNSRNILREVLGLDKPDPYIKTEFLDFDVAHPRRGTISKQWEKLKKSFNLSYETSKKKKTKALEKTVNDTIDAKANFHKTFKMPENAMKAVEYYKASEATMYSYDPGDPLTNIMAAMPKRDKNYFREFLDAPEKDRKDILSLAPKYMRRALQSAYKMEVDPKESLDEYFTTHYLPGQNWDGWQENFDMKSMKVKMVQSQGDSLQSNNLWQDDKLKADMYGPMPIPNMDYKTKNIQEVKNKLEDVLGTAGYTNLNFSFRFGAHTPSIDLDVYQTNKDKYDSKLKERLGIQ